MLIMNIQLFKRAKIQRVMRSLLCGFLTLLASPAAVIAEAPMGRTLNPIMLARGGNEAQLAVVKWAAFGSGCRSAEEIPIQERDVQFEILPKNASQTPRLIFDLTFPEFSLSRGKQLERDGTLELYSECALRFAIRGQTGLRLKRIEGTARLEIQKDKGATLLVYNELRFGQFGGDEERHEYDAETGIRKTLLELNLAKDLAPARADGISSCGTDQVLFYDFTLFAKKSRKASQVTATFQAPKRASLKLEYENCS